MLEKFKLIEKKIKLFLIYIRRILFVRNTFKVSFFLKIKMNLFGGFLADQYVLYDLKHNRKKDYLSEFDWYKSRYINEPFEALLNNKVICTEFLKQYVDVPEIYHIKNHNILISRNSAICGYEDVVKKIEEKKNVFIKPISAGKGNGVKLISFDSDKYAINGEVCIKDNIIQLLRDSDNWLICQAKKQAKYLDELYDKTVNTMRIITWKNIHTNEWEIFFAVQRIGVEESVPVDNGSKGGLISKIDLVSGELSEARCLHNLNSYKFHPNSNTKIKGILIPNWESIKNYVLELSKKMPYLNFIAWDALITDKGPCIIEANSSSGVNIIQLWGGQRNRELGEFYRHYGIIK